MRACGFFRSYINVFFCLKILIIQGLLTYTDGHMYTASFHLKYLGDFKYLPKGFKNNDTSFENPFIKLIESEKTLSMATLCGLQRPTNCEEASILSKFIYSLP